MDKIRVSHIKKKFENHMAVNDISLSVEEGSFFTLLGPSGCGKTTFLRMIAGFITPDSGNIWLGEKEVTMLPPEKRNIGMVFQNYALFPHLNVYDNVAYGLKVRGIRKKDIQNKVESYLGLVRLDGYEERLVSELSGGEQQRVALARALIIEPEILLLDEPLCNLDTKLRVEMRRDIKKLQAKLGITTVFVTHDQNEALTLSDQIAVFNEGECIQIGSPKEIYQNPRTPFVATFLGETNLLYTETCQKLELLEHRGTVSIRPEMVQLSKTKQNQCNEWKGTIKNVEFNGNYSEYRIELKGIVLKAIVMNGYNDSLDLVEGDSVFVHIPKGAMKFFG